MGYIITGVLVIIGIIVFSRFSKPTTNQTTNTPTKKPSKKYTEFKRGKDGTYDKSWFVDEYGKFRFPRYKSSKESLVKYKDVSEYKDFWGDLDSNEKKNINKRFEFELNYELIEFEIEDFHDFLDRLSVKHLKKYLIKKFDSIYFNDLTEFLIEYKNKISKEKYLFSNEYTDTLYKNNFLSEYTFSSDKEKNEYYIEYINSLNVSDLKELSKKRGLKVSLKKQELINQIIEYNDFNDIPFPYIPNEKTNEFINYILSLYLKDIQNQIDTFHPLYIQKMWDVVKLDSGIDEYCKEFDNPDYKEIYKSKYWEERMYIDYV